MLTPGRRLGHYRVVAPLGAGGMGVVYRARDDRLDRDVAIKVLPDEVANDADRLARFEREAKALAMLSHPNILGIHELGEEAGLAFVVTELLEGETLRDRLREGPVPWRKAVEIGAAVADGLAAAHAHGLVHRDLKPENVFLTADGRVKVLDFGLAKLHALEAPTPDVTEAPTGPPPTASGVVLGTVGYMAPEQARGKPADARSDIFALGCLLHELVTGHRAFAGESTAETLSAILKDEPPSLADVDPPCTSELDRVVRRCLEKCPEARFQSAADLAYSLRSIGTDRTVPGTALAGAGSRRVHRLRSWIALGGAFVVLIAVAVWMAWVRPHRQTAAGEAPRIVVLPFENLGAAEDAFVADGLSEELTARLAAVSAFRVISRTSAVQYAGSEKSIRQIGEELDVDYVLEGTVRWAHGADGTNRIRVTPQLIRVADDTHMWAEAYDRTLDDIFAVQSEIAQSVTDHLGLTLVVSTEGPAEARPTDNVEAYQAYLQGRYWATRPHFTHENWEKRMAAFARAVEIDPDFALAHAELARGHALAHYLRHDLSPARLRAADAAAARAMALAPDSLRVHLNVGYYRLWAYRDAGGALAEFERAGGGRPDNADVLEAKANLYVQAGRWDAARDAFQRAFALSPRDADLIAEAGWMLSVTRRYPEAILACDQAIALSPDALWPYLFKVITLWSWKGATAGVRTVLEAAPKVQDDWLRWTWYNHEMFEKRYEQALVRLGSAAEGWVRVKMWARPDALLASYALDRLGRKREAEAARETARRLLDAAVEASPEDPRLRSALGIVHAFQGRAAEAVRGGSLACDLLPCEKDAFYCLPFVVDLAHIYALVGDTDAAIATLDGLLSNPSWISTPFLRADPTWDPLRGNPQFEALLARHEVAP